MFLMAKLRTVADREEGAKRRFVENQAQAEGLRAEN